jgi:hypothetical protein
MNLSIKEKKKNQNTKINKNNIWKKRKTYYKKKIKKNIK